MGKILTYFFIAFMCVVGGGSSIYVVIAMPAMIIWKLYRAARYHENPLE